MAKWAWFSMLMAVGCGTTAPCPPPPAVAAPPPAPVTTSSPAKASPARDWKVAVLPIEDENLFRDERQSLRQELFTAVKRVAPEYELLSLDVVDKQLRPLSKLGKRCAFEGREPSRRTGEFGWASTDVTVVYGGDDNKPDLWVMVRGMGAQETLVGPWSKETPRVDRYREAFKGLVRRDELADMLGGLGMSAKRANRFSGKQLTICEHEDFKCAPQSAAWADRVEQLEQCYAGEDVASDTFLIESASRCERVDQHTTEGPLAKREQCVCKALSTSAGMNATSGRRRLRLGYEAADLKGNVRPAVRLIEVSSNLRASIRRSTKSHLTVDNVDSLANALARCKGMLPGEIVPFEIDVAEDGRVAAATPTMAFAGHPESRCVARALKRGAFDCTSNGKPAKLQVVFMWPRSK